MQIKPSKLIGFHTALAEWYAVNGRHDLPWRTTKSPYEIWVSEVMLQQTQVATVEANYYAPFLKQFPSIEALAAAPREAVMKAWEGLGYYRRAGFLHDAAIEVVSRQSLVFSKDSPETSDQRLQALLRLPGIGRNTAHAILAFGYHQPYAVMEANVKRVVARIFAEKHASDTQLFDYAAQLLSGGDLSSCHSCESRNPKQPAQKIPACAGMTKSSTKKASQNADARSGERASHEPAKQRGASGKNIKSSFLRKQESTANAQLDSRLRGNDKALQSNQLMNPFHYNQAMMDLGALICTPKNPACGICPAAEICAGKATPEAYPAKKIKKAVPTRTPHIWVIENARGALFLCKREAALLGGLYGFPQAEIPPKKSTKLGEATHVYSHFKLHAQVHYVKGNAPKHLHNQGSFYAREDIGKLPLSKVDRKVLQLLAD